MKIIRGLHNFNFTNFACVTTIGNFDGVHLGHQEIIKQLNVKAKEYQLPSLVMMFEPHPKEFFAANNPKAEEAPIRLCRFRDKIRLLQTLDVDYVLVINFNSSFASLTADEFVEQLLVKQLGIHYIQIGDDFCYGMQRQGNYQHLKQKSQQFGFELEATPTCLYERIRVSSTRIREVLNTGDIDTAKKLLSHPYSVSGHVQHGAKKGRTIGFPTANIRLPCQRPALTGVYAVVLCLTKLDKKVEGIANIGYRPTVDGKTALLEVHIFNFNEDLYGQYVHVEFLKKIRDEQKFESFDALKQQIMDDVVIAKDYFKI
ncbi:MAG: bifunctional riboflavin kinase/FAD synthetase [Gammaproteobacteria bacterium]|nr:bifunctional riboflavin kinase/FAD synthetase [Gammaproteobacteria bacterium]